MPEYTLIDPVTGQHWNSTEAWLTRNLRLNCILLRGEEHLGIITHRDLVLFARWCAGEMLARLEGEPHQSVVHVLRLVDKWLEDQQSVTSEELEAAAGAAWAAAHAARAATHAAWAAEAAALAAHAARAATHAAWAAEAARNAAWYTKASYKVQAQQFVEQLCAENKKEQE